MNIEIANRLVQLRKKSGLSQEALAEQLGISRQAVSKWERAEASPDTDNLIQLAKIYSISIDELLSLGENAAPQEKPDNNAAAETAADHKANGLHFQDNTGEVYIGQDGIHAADNAKREGIRIKDSIYVTVDGQDYTLKEARQKFGHKTRHHPARLPLIVIITLIYIAIGLIYHSWHPAWLLFLFIPLINGLLIAIQEKNAKRFPYTLLAVLLFLSAGFFYNAWNPAWIVFLTIPLYHSLIRYIQQKKNTEST